MKEVDQNLIDDVLIKKDKKKIEELKKKLNNTMKFKYFMFYLLFVIFSAWCIYYSTIFCNIYRGSSKNWIADGFVGLIIDYIKAIILIFLLSISRILVRDYNEWYD